MERSPLGPGGTVVRTADRAGTGVLGEALSVDEGSARLDPATGWSPSRDHCMEVSRREETCVDRALSLAECP
jgi:hypothetical protein